MHWKVACPLRVTGLAVVLAVLTTCGGRSKPSPAERPTYASDGGLQRDVGLPERLPNLVVILVDTLRSDTVLHPGDTWHPGSFASMPYLGTLAGEGVSFSDAVAPAPWTLPSVASLLTGLLPSDHGANDSRDMPRLDASVTTFAEVLANGYGYETAAFTGGNWFGHEGGVLQGFQKGAHDFALQGTEPVVGAWARERDPERPFLLFLHTFEVHEPYGAQNHPWPEPLRPPLPIADLDRVTEPWQLTRCFFLDLGARMQLLERFGQQGFVDPVVRYVGRGFAEAPRPELAHELRTRYIEGANWFDGVLENSVAHLRELGLLDDTVLVVTSDHGEAFGEHGILGHGRQLYDELIRVPLVMVGPPPFQGGAEIPGTVGLIDVFPTFLDHAGMAPLPASRGTSFLHRVRGEVDYRPVVSEEKLYASKMGYPIEGVRLSVRSPRWKFIITYDVLHGVVREEAYDLPADPEEQEDLADEAGNLSPHIPFGESFCEEVEAVRDRVWELVERNHLLYGTVYGAGVGNVQGARSPGCGSR